MNVYILELHSVNNAFVVEITAENQDANFTLYFRNGGAPTMAIYDTNHVLIKPKSSLNVSTPTLRYFLPNSLINSTKYYVGVRSQIGGENAVVNYTFTSYEVGCYYWSDHKSEWTTSGCTVSKYLKVFKKQHRQRRAHIL